MNMLCQFLHVFIGLHVFLHKIGATPAFGSSPGFGNISFKCIEKKRQALFHLKDKLVDNYGRLSSWTDTKDCCKWEGVHYDSQTGHVTFLDLRGPGDYYHPNNVFETGTKPLGGMISSSLLELKQLRYLDLSYHSFFDIQIPEFIGSFNKLKYLNLSYSYFSGPIPRQIGNLSQLQILDLSNLFLSSKSLDWLSNLHSLRYLDLSAVNLTEATTWLQALGNLPVLHDLNLHYCGLPQIVAPFSEANSSAYLATLDLSFNNLSSSSVYNWLFNFSSSLTHVNLQSNNLQGSIPDAFGDMTSLVFLDLSRNLISGPLLGFEKFPNLREIYLGYNMLNGPFPESIGSLSHLEILSLPSNHLEGNISEPHFSKLSQLRTFSLSFNPLLVLNFSSIWFPPFQLNVVELSFVKLGPLFPNWLLNQYNIYFLDISGAGVSDSIPTWFWDISSNMTYLNISHNQIHGVLPDLSSKFSVSPIIYLSYNNLTGLLPSLPPDMSMLDLSRNNFWGSISVLCDTTGILVFLDLSNNLLSGEVPNCLTNRESLRFLSLANNHLLGKIPHFIYADLEALYLRSNNFTGEIPSSLRSCIGLKILDLGGNNLSGKIPSWLGNDLSDLVLLSLRSNEFHGIIPSSMCLLKHIQILDLSMNNLSGRIPKCLRNLTAMTREKTSIPTIDLSLVKSIDMITNSVIGSEDVYSDSAFIVLKGIEAEYKSILGLVKIINLSNNLTGEIPCEISTLVGLLGLNLSSNSLHGSIPPSFGELRLLNFLDLFGNQLSGGIPSSLSQLSHLGMLNLSYNNLS